MTKEVKQKVNNLKFRNTISYIYRLYLKNI